MFALDVAAAREAGITPLPFAGEPQWSEPVSAALARATQVALAGRANAGTLHVLLGLLDIEEGVTGEVLSRCGVRPKDGAQRLEGGLRGATQGEITEQRATLHYDQALAFARSLAKRAGSPVVLENHILRALLETPSAAMDKALVILGTNRRQLLAMLDTFQECHGPVTTVFASSMFKPQLP